MKKVYLIGDSIRQIGYGMRVKEILSAEFDVCQPEDNCRGAQYTLRGLFDWAEEMKGSEVIHWNNGHWDLCRLFGDGTFTPIDQYVDTMVRIARILKTRAPKIIFSTTTPVTDANPYNSNADVMAFNEAASSALQKEGVIINDLFGLVYPKVNEYIRSDDNIHLTEAGIEVCALSVSDAIRKAAK